MHEASFAFWLTLAGCDETLALQIVSDLLPEQSQRLQLEADYKGLTAQHRQLWQGCKDRLGAN